MSNGGGVIVICGTAGTPVVDKTIEVYDAPVSVAIKIDKDALIALLEAGGMSHLVAQAKVGLFAATIEHSYWAWGEIAEKLGIHYERHTPHAQP